MPTALKTLVIYYSLDGNTAFIAKTLAETIGADTLALQTKTSLPSSKILKILSGGKQVVTKQEPELLPLTKDPADYDLIFLGTPVWVGTYAPALRSFFARKAIQAKNIALFCCYAGSESKTFTKMKEALVGNNVLGEIGFREPLKKAADDAQARAAAWAKEMAALAAGKK